MLHRCITSRKEGNLPDLNTPNMKTRSQTKKSARGQQRRPSVRKPRRAQLSAVHLSNAWDFALKRTKGLERYKGVVDSILAAAQEGALAERYGVEEAVAF